MFIFLDTETTGTDKDDRLCQIAFKTEAGLIANELFNPGKPISMLDIFSFGLISIGFRGFQELTSCLTLEGITSYSLSVHHYNLYDKKRTDV